MLIDKPIPYIECRTSLFSTAYLPPISYFRAMISADKVYLDAHEHYQKQSYRNRCRIATANGMETLSIPVESNGGKKIAIKDVRISDHASWRQNHWRAITSAYRNSPFFEYLQDDFAPFYEKKWPFLWEYNLALINLILNILEIEKPIVFSDKYEEEPSNKIDWRTHIHPKGQTIDQMKPYYQVFEHKFGFISDLSIIDLIFNMGNEAIFTLNN